MKLIFAAAAVVAVLHAQNPAGTLPNQPLATASTGAISGTVFDGATGTPVADAFVTLSGQPAVALPAGYQNRQITDARGRFVFLNLPESGRFQISAGKFGHLDGGYGRDTGPTDPLRDVLLTNGRWIGGLRVNIWRPSAVSGRVVDEAGAPLVGVFVRAYGRIRIGGREDLAAGPTAVTDDNGLYRIGNLLPGRYVIQVPSMQMSVPAGTRVGAPVGNVPDAALEIDDSNRLVIGRFPLPPPPAGGRAMTYAPTFHPNATAVADAATLTIQYGEDRTGVDIALSPTPAVRVSGVVEGPTEALNSMTLRLLPAGMENLSIGAETATAFVGANGTFTFINVPPGAYTLDAPMTFNGYSLASGSTSSGGFVGMRGGPSIPPPPPRAGFSSSSQSIEAIPGVSLTTLDSRGVTGAKIPPHTARMTITVPASDLSGVVVRLRPNAVLRGRLVADADPAVPAPATPLRFSIFMDPAGGQPALGQPRTSATAEEPSTFELTGIQAGDYFLRVQGFTGGWLVKSIAWRGRDFTTTPFDAAANEEFSGVVVTVTNRVASLTGSVRAADGSISESAMVVIFPALAANRVNAGLWSSRMTSTIPGNTGAYRFASLPAGDYLVAAIDRSRRSTWRDPEFLAVLERQARPVKLDWGQSLAQDLAVVTVR